MDDFEGSGSGDRDELTLDDVDESGVDESSVAGDGADGIDSEGVDTDALLDVATRAVRTGGEYLLEGFRTGRVAGEYGSDDVKAVVDRETERRVVDVIHDAFPDHAVHGEESGRLGDGRYEWVVDPLDGTNNFASGIPLFATAIAVLRDGEPIVSSIYEPLPDTLYTAVVGKGAIRNGEPLVVRGRGAVGGDIDTVGTDTIDTDTANTGAIDTDTIDIDTADTDAVDRPLAHGTVSFVAGLSAVRDPDLRAVGDEIRETLEGQCKRVVRTWAPCVDWGLVAVGSLDGIVCFHPDVYEQHAGALLAAEAGVVSVERDRIYVGAGDEKTAETLWKAVEEAVTRN